MTALIVGGDKLGNIPQTLSENGVDKYIHWSGRKKGMRNKKIPTDTDLVIILYDFVEHNLTKLIKNQTKLMSIPCIYSKRATTDLSNKLRCSNCCRNCPIKRNN